MYAMMSSELTIISQEWDYRNAADKAIHITVIVF